MNRERQHLRGSLRGSWRTSTADLGMAAIAVVVPRNLWVVHAAADVVTAEVLCKSVSRERRVGRDPDRVLVPHVAAAIDLCRRREARKVCKSRAQYCCMASTRSDCFVEHIQLR